MATWTMPLYMTAFRNALRGRAGLVNVQVMSAPIDKSISELEVITVIDVDTDEEQTTVGNQARGRTERYTLEGVLQVLVAGEGEEDAVTARDRAAELLAEIEMEVRDNPDMGLNGPGNQVIMKSEVTKKRLRQAIQDGYRRAVIEFDVLVTTRI